VTPSTSLSLEMLAPELQPVRTTGRAWLVCHQLANSETCPASSEPWTRLTGTGCRGGNFAFDT